MYIYIGLRVDDVKINVVTNSIFCSIEKSDYILDMTIIAPFALLVAGPSFGVELGTAIRSQVFQQNDMFFWLADDVANV